MTGVRHCAVVTSRVTVLGTVADRGEGRTDDLWMGNETVHYICA